jgi:hypothetical protein
MTFLKARENRRKGKEIKGLLKSTKIITSTTVRRLKQLTQALENLT